MPSARPAARSKKFHGPKSPEMSQDTPAAAKYSGSMSRPPNQAYWVECRASCLHNGVSNARLARRVMITLPSVYAGAGGTGRR